MKRLLIAVVLPLIAACASTSGTVDKAKMSEGYYMKGLSYFEQRDYGNALAELQRAVQTDKNNKNAYYAIGLVMDMQGKPEEAVKYYKEAIDVDSNFSEAHNAMGVAYLKQQKWKDAMRAFQKALDNKLYTTPHVPYLNIGDLHMAQKEYDKAVIAYRESKRFVNQDLTVLKLGTALLEAGRVKESVAELQEGVALSPKNAGMRYTLALALLKSGRKKDALAEFRKAAELAPDTDIARQAQDYIKTLR